MKTIKNIFQGFVSCVLFFAFCYGVGVLSAKVVPIKKPPQISCGKNP